MLSVSNDIGHVPGEKSNYDTLTGKITIKDFSEQLRDVLPNFHQHVTFQRQMAVGPSLEKLHELANMPGKPFDVNANLQDDSLPEYLHSLLLAIKANRDRIEAIYAPVE